MKKPCHLHVYKVMVLALMLSSADLTRSHRKM